jgi:macrodomain Ter protein organizer (MatP/YcbG family)
LCVGSFKKMCDLGTQEHLNPELVNILRAALRYRRATVESSHDGASPDNSSLHTGKIYSFPLHISSFFSPAATASRRRGNDLGATIKYLRKTTSGAAGIGLGAPR